MQILALYSLAGLMLQRRQLQINVLVKSMKAVECTPGYEEMALAVHIIAHEVVE